MALTGTGRQIMQRWQSTGTHKRKGHHLMTIPDDVVVPFRAPTSTKRRARSAPQLPSQRSTPATPQDERRELPVVEIIHHQHHTGRCELTVFVDGVQVPVRTEAVFGGPDTTQPPAWIDGSDAFMDAVVETLVATPPLDPTP